jgi:hypothetical protein
VLRVCIGSDIVLQVCVFIGIHSVLRVCVLERVCCLLVLNSVTETLRGYASRSRSSFLLVAFTVSYTDGSELAATRILAAA